MHRSARVCLNQLNQGKQQIVKAFCLRRLDEIQDCRHLFWQQQAFDPNLVTQATAHSGFQRLSLTSRLNRRPARCASECVLWQRARFQEGLLTDKPNISASIRGKAPDCAALQTGSSRSKLSVTPGISAKATPGFLARVWERARTAPRERERTDGRKARLSEELRRPTLKRAGRSVGLECDRKNGLSFSGTRLAWQKIGQQIQAFENRQQRTHAERTAGVKKVVKQGYTAIFQWLVRATGTRGILPVTEGRRDARPASCGGKAVKHSKGGRGAGVLSRRLSGMRAGAAVSLSGPGHEERVSTRREKKPPQAVWQHLQGVGKTKGSWEQMFGGGWRGNRQVGSFGRQKFKVGRRVAGVGGGVRATEFLAAL